LIAGEVADMISFGAMFLANPDLTHRLASGAPFNVPDRATFYGGGERGYTDYPRLADTSSDDPQLERHR
jgi:N-ethylmaleimide reductase